VEGPRKIGDACGERATRLDRLHVLTVESVPAIFKVIKRTFAMIETT
jgi:hypothetical protein